MSVLQPKIQSIIDGIITITIDDPVAALQFFNQLLIYRTNDGNSTVNGPFSILAMETLDRVTTQFVFEDVTSDPTLYYKAQFYNSNTMATSVFSELAQEKAIYKEYSLPTNTATYPPEITLSEQDRTIVESVRVTVGDVGLIENDYFNSSDRAEQFNFMGQISADKLTWELVNFKGWPQKVIVNGVEKTNLFDPQVIGYRFLTFSGVQPVITGTLSVYYNHFRFSDREILLAFSRANNLLISIALDPGNITSEMLIMQASIMLLEGEIREDIQSAVRIKDGDTEYDNTGIIVARTEDLADLKRKMKELLDRARTYQSYALPGVRLE